ncbi:DUF1350 family protein [Chloroflexales bacterium ZM16-3]|nr:DUF1350 family protein [Chloroflexales bacterium ZM16-3]
MSGFTLKSRSWVRKHPNPRRVIEFYGGEAIGVTPHLSYGALFDYLYATEQTVIAMPVPIGPNHEEIARVLLEERRLIRKWLGYDPEQMPYCMVGHSIGGQMIALLASLTDIKTNTITIQDDQFKGLMGTPLLFMAPYIGDFDAPSWASWLVKALGLSFKPTMKDLIAMFESEQAQLFAKAGLLSFAGDTVAGNVASCPEPIAPTCQMSIPWFHHFLKKHPCSEIPGDHFTPMGTLIGDRVYRLSLNDFSEPFPRKVDTELVSLLDKLNPSGAAAPPN